MLKIFICITFISTLLAQNSRHQEIIERLEAGQKLLKEGNLITTQEYKEAIKCLRQFAKTTQGFLDLLKIFGSSEGETSELFEEDILSQINKAVDKYNQQVLEDLNSRTPAEILYNRYRVFKKDSEKSPFY